jgi:hypothetical protein
MSLLTRPVFLREGNELNVDSRDGTGTTTNFSITINSAINVRELSLLEAEIPVTWYNVNSSNNKFDFNDGVARTVTITPSNYTATTLASALQTGLNASGTGLTFTVTYSTATYKFTVAATGGFSMPFATGTNHTTSICLVLGFTATDHGSAASQVSDNAADLIGEPYIYLKCTSITGVNEGILSSNSNDTGVLARIPVNVNFGDVILYTAPKEHPTLIFNGTNITSLSFSLTYRNNSVIDNNGMKISFKLGIYT